ncbi:MAG TPA: helix-turn-helix transcriptional regulator [Puia sp.]|uniref:helix-turn-helix transcriptional regulator n=1 Tax=Puia sp. TaxID=2045100 RepID=UPI002BDB0113|nr:helix-turn-helix transcriptional regulator [Puia sp.]HVU96601.1 helix-turn-helix transcriptional regulator [Puia sp.]
MHYLGKNLRYLRKQMSKTQSEIASLIKKGQTTIGNWENGISEPNLDELLVISNFFDIPLDALIKVDLAESNMAHRPSLTSTAVYDHGAESSPTVQEKDDRLSYVLQEIKSLREEMARLDARIK